MAETATTDFGSETRDLSQGDATTIRTIAAELDEADPNRLDIYEGELSGALYVETDTGYQRGTVTSQGLQVTQVPTPDEPLEPLARIEPDPGETVEDAVDSLSFAGD